MQPIATTFRAFPVAALFALGVGCPTAPVEGDVQPAPAAQPEAGEPADSEPTVEPEVSPEPSLTGCAFDSEASIHLDDPQLWRQHSPGRLERGPGALTRMNGRFNNTIFNTDRPAIWFGTSDHFGDYDSTWTMALTSDQQDVSFRDLQSNTVRWTLPPPVVAGAGSTFVHGLGLSADDSTAAALFCWTSQDVQPVESGAVVLLADTATGEVLREMTFEGCPQSWDGTPKLLLSHTGMTGAVVGIPVGGVTPFTLADGVGAPIAVVDTEALPENFQWYGDAIVDAALSPDGSVIGIAGADRQVRMVDAVTGELQWSAPSGLVNVNQNTYIPSAESPVGFSPDGTHFLFLGDTPPMPEWDEEPELAFSTLHMVETGTGVPTKDLLINTPLFGQSPSGVAPGAPLALLYDRNGVTVMLEGGTAHFGCEAVPSAGLAPLTMTVDAPATISRADPTYMITVTTPAAAGAAVRGIVWDGHSYSVATFDESVSGSVGILEDQETVTVTLFVDNGHEAIVEDITMNVVP